MNSVIGEVEVEVEEELMSPTKREETEKVMIDDWYFLSNADAVFILINLTVSQLLANAKVL